MSEFYRPESAKGVRWNDPAFQIAWPMAIDVISERDRTYADFEQAYAIAEDPRGD
jgi:dTDP-4-dehydrorhamnose 3,5-epimerase